MSRQLLYSVLIGSVLVISQEFKAFAQWPLGKDLSGAPVKSGEPSGYLTGSGRFQVFVSPNVKGHTFMLDSESGRLWIFKKDNASGDISLKKIPVEKIDELSAGANHRKN